MKKVLALGLSVCMMASVTACSTSGTSAESTTASAQAQETKETNTAAEAAESSEEAQADGSSAEKPEQTEPLLVYLNDFDAVIGDMFKEATGYDVEVVVGNGAETMSRIEAEQSNPQWDVVWIDSMYDIYNPVSYTHLYLIPVN